MVGMDFFKKFFLKILLNVLLAFILVKGHQQQHEPQQQDESNPEFLAPLENLTVTQGRDVSFTCVVDELGTYKVAWLKSDSKAILAIHTRMVALNQRLSVTHNGHNAWKLHIAHVQLNDSGSYMCQVNTNPMRSQSGYLDVVVSPDILNEPDLNSATLEEGITNEGGSTQMICTAVGVPDPTVQWRREDGKDIVLRTEGRDNKQSVKYVDGERLFLQQVQRTDMGGYLCIASNGVPPSVSKRFDVQVNFPPTVKSPNNVIGAPVDSNVTMHCLVEVFPKPLNGWYRNDGTTKLHEGAKYHMTESMKNAYTWQLNLTIYNLQKSDFAAYTCTSVNALGKQETRIRLQELWIPKVAVTTTPIPYVYTTARPPRRKHTNHNNKGGHDVSRAKETLAPNHENEIVGDINSIEVHTQVPAAVRPSDGSKNSITSMSSSSANSINGYNSGNSISSSSGSASAGVGNAGNGNSMGIDKPWNAQTPSADPSQKTPWTYSSSIQNTTMSNFMIWIFCLAFMLPLL